MSFEKNYSIQYGDLKKAIYKSVSYGTDNSDLEFIIDADKMAKQIKDNKIGVTMVPIGLTGELVEVRDIPLIYEYFKADRIAWFERNRAVTSLLFVTDESLDDRGRELIKTIEEARTNADVYIKNDIVNCAAELMSNYACCTAMVVSYRSNNPDSKYKNNLTISIRANNILIGQNNKANEEATKE